MKENYNKLINNIICFALIIIIIISNIYIVKYLSMKKEAKEESELLNETNIKENTIESKKKWKYNIYKWRNRENV